MGLKIADAAEAEAEEYFASIFTRCDWIMAATPQQAHRVKEYGVDRVEVVPLGVDLDQFHPHHRDESLRAELGATKSTPVLIYAGRFDVEKHVQTLVEAHARLPPTLGAHLVLVGNGPLRQKLEDRTRTESRLHVLPFQSDPARYLASADVYVTAGPHETFGLAVIEAQACQLPVVGVNAGALRERGLEGLGFLAPVDDPAIMAELILRALADRSTLGLNARRHVEQHFSWNRTFQTLLSFYEN